MDENSSSSIETLLDEPVGLWKVLEEIVVVHVVDLYDMMFISSKKVLVQRQPEHRQDMGDVGFFQSFLASQSEYPDNACGQISCSQEQCRMWRSKRQHVHEVHLDAPADVEL